MSVLLTASRIGPQQRAERERKEKEKASKRAEKSRQMKKAELDELRKSLGTLPPQTDDVRVWTFVLENNPHAVIFYVAKMEIYVDRIKIENVVSRYTEQGAAIEFKFYDYDAAIESGLPSNTKKGAKPVHSLLIDGQEVPANSV